MAGPRKGVLKPRKYKIGELEGEAERRHKRYGHPPTQLSPSRTVDSWEYCDEELCVAYRKRVDQFLNGEEEDPYTESEF